MAASIELYDQAGNLIFDSSKPRILRYVGKKNLIWTFTNTVPNGQGRIYYWDAAITDFPNWTFSQLMLLPIFTERVVLENGRIYYYAFTQGSIDTNAMITWLNTNVPTVTVYKF